MARSTSQATPCKKARILAMVGHGAKKPPKKRSGQNANSDIT